MYLWSVYFVIFPSINAFLLESSNQQNVTGGYIVSGNHYLTISRFLEAQKQQQLNIEEQHRNAETFRKSVDATFALLTSQLQDKFVDFERKLTKDVKRNETCRVVDELEKKLLELESNNTAVLSEIGLTKDENKQLKTQLSTLMNKIFHIDERVNNIEQLKSIQSLQDLQTVKQQIQSIKSQTAVLSQNQFARNQDFLALYNQSSVGIAHAVTRLQHLESYENESLTNTKHFEERLQILEAYKNTALMTATSLTKKTAAMQTQITYDIRKVAITACSVSKDESSGYIVPFAIVKTSIGINNSSYFKSSGKFKCEYEGLYAVTVSLTAYNTLINYGIYLNGNEYTAVYELNNKVVFQRGSTTVVVNLHRNDILWVQLNDRMYVHERNSCIAIVMIK
ncbi:Hypothetical predicted protein [Mytilus galloprovincialis]|uniref:C1q domain-containing protein n=1 Tax=Mytilus galloprovincialis TaxID=29158 RepID=A0A8B6DH44_MYTGA|nr:Hypothetical predicted protein [Mytilus galloprovincialis]